MKMPQFLEKQRYNHITLNNKPYKIDTFIFLGIIGILLIASIYLLAINDFDRDMKIYINCSASETGYCNNPFYMKAPECNYAKDINLCTTEKFPVGFSYGTPPPPYVKEFIWYGIIAVLLGVLLNHWIHNKGFKIKGDE